MEKFKYDIIDWVCVGKRMRSRRMNLKMSLRNLAAKLGCSHELLRKYETNSQKEIHINSEKILIALMISLDCTIDYLMGKVEQHDKIYISENGKRLFPQSLYQCLSASTSRSIQQQIKEFVLKKSLSEPSYLETISVSYNLDKKPLLLNSEKLNPQQLEASDLFKKMKSVDLDNKQNYLAIYTLLESYENLDHDFILNCLKLNVALHEDNEKWERFKNIFKIYSKQKRKYIHREEKNDF